MLPLLCETVVTEAFKFLAKREVKYVLNNQMIVERRLENCSSSKIVDQNVFVIEAKSVQTMTGVSVSVGAAESRDEIVVNGDYTNCCKIIRLSVGLSTFIDWST